MRLRNKTALISGASRNIGKTIALTFAREGADVVLVARTGDELEKVAAECASFGVQTLALTADVGNPDDVSRAAQQALERFGKVDVLMSVAAVRPHRNVWEYSVDEWQRVFNVNLHSTFYWARALVPSMIERKSGSIVACGGVQSLTSQLNNAVTVASKHGLFGLIKSLALELGPHGIRANLIAVGSIVTKKEFVNTDSSKAHVQGLMDNSPLRRGGTTQELANVALFLASDESSYVTGDRIVAAGGRYM
jgi:3-oxoacyl-[acyl-carrier protein] reductase